MRFLLVSRIDIQGALEFTEKIKTVLENEGSEVLFENDTAKSLGTAGSSIGGANADAVIIVGGDGTILLYDPADDRANPGSWYQLG